VILFIKNILVEGRTFSMGYSFKGRLGNFPKDECDKKIISPLPRSIKELEGIQITQVIAGNFHSLAVSSKGKLFGWGENKNFVFGLVSNEDEDRRGKAEVHYFPVDLPVNKSIIVKKYFFKKYLFSKIYFF
jgi:alpha-tubulin suppressor-like RCC1 family protein